MTTRVPGYNCPRTPLSRRGPEVTGTHNSKTTYSPKGSERSSQCSGGGCADFAVNSVSRLCPVKPEQNNGKCGTTGRECGDLLLPADAFADSGISIEGVKLPFPSIGFVFGSMNCTEVRRSETLVEETGGHRTDATPEDVAHERKENEEADDCEENEEVAFEKFSIRIRSCCTDFVCSTLLVILDGALAHPDRKARKTMCSTINFAQISTGVASAAGFETLVQDTGGDRTDATPEDVAHDPLSPTRG